MPGSLPVRSRAGSRTMPALAPSRSPEPGRTAASSAATSSWRSPPSSSAARRRNRHRFSRALQPATGRLPARDGVSIRASLQRRHDWNQAEPPAAGELIDTPHSRARRAIAQRLTESKQTIPHFYLRGSAQVEELLELRARLYEASPAKISINDFVIKAAACAHKLVPAMNVIWTTDYVRMMPTVDLGTAVATATGLVTPVLRGVEPCRSSWWRPRPVTSPSGRERGGSTSTNWKAAPRR